MFSGFSGLADESNQRGKVYPLNCKEYQYTNVFEYIDMFTAWVKLASVRSRKDSHCNASLARCRMKSEFAERLPDGWERFSRFFFALGDTTRQQILLVFEPGEEICVNDIARLFKITRPAISHHLKVLRNAELLVCQKRGKEVYYRVNQEHCAEVMRVVREFIITQTPAPALAVTAFR